MKRVWSGEGEHGHPAVAAALARARDWLIRDALPFWADVGFDRRRCNFHERLDLGGAPLDLVPRRTMAQARQIYVFSHAAELGLNEAGEIALIAARTLVRDHWQPDGAPGWVFSVAPNGSAHDRRRDTYAHAFALFGLASAYRLEPNVHLNAIADETFKVLDGLLAADEHGGYLDGDVRSDALRRQNPHMHLFEASLAWYLATGKACYLARAGEIFGLFSTRFFHSESGALGEYFDDRWQAAPGQTGSICEPGHHFEWVWLLEQFGGLSGRHVGRYTDALFAHAARHGRGSNGLLYDEVDFSGAPVTRSQRSWPHTESVKAAAARAEAGRGTLDENARHAAHDLTILMDHYLGRPFAGGWIDHLTEDGRSKVDYVPSSTLYHVFLAIAEADRIFAAPEPA